MKRYGILLIFLTFAMATFNVHASLKNLGKAWQEKLEEKTGVVLEPEPESLPETNPSSQKEASNRTVTEDVLNKILKPNAKPVVESQGSPREPSSTGVSNQVDTNSPIEQLAKEDIRKATTIGNYAGMIVGGGLAIKACKKYDKACDNPVVRTAIVGVMLKLGSNIGSSIGKEVGETAANRRRAYASEHDYLESEIQASEKAISVREEGIRETNNDIEKSRQRITELTEKEALTREDIREAKKLKKDISRQVETNKVMMAQYNEKIAYLDHSLSTSEENANAKKEDKKLWQKKHASLQEKRDALLAQRDTVEEQNGQLANDQRMLDKILS